MTSVANDEQCKLLRNGRHMSITMMPSSCIPESPGRCVVVIIDLEQCSNLSATLAALTPILMDNDDGAASGGYDDAKGYDGAASGYDGAASGYDLTLKYGSNAYTDINDPDVKYNGAIDWVDALTTLAAAHPRLVLRRLTLVGDTDTKRYYHGGPTARRVTDAALEAVFKAHGRHLEHLALDGIHGHPDHLSEASLRAVANHCPHLTSFVLVDRDGCFIQSHELDGLVAMVMGLGERLERLSVSRQCMPDLERRLFTKRRLVQVLASGTCPRLRHLHIDVMNIVEDLFYEVHTEVARGCPLLEEVRVGAGRIKDGLPNVLAACRHIRVLDVVLRHDDTERLVQAYMADRLRTFHAAFQTALADRLPVCGDGGVSRIISTYAYPPPRFERIVARYCGGKPTTWILTPGHVERWVAMTDRLDLHMDSVGMRLVGMTLDEEFLDAIIQVAATHGRLLHYRIVRPGSYDEEHPWTVVDSSSRVWITSFEVMMGACVLKFE